MTHQEVLKRTLGERLEKARKVNGWTQTELADRLGKSKRTVVRYETDAAIPSLPLLIKWADECAVPLTWLIDEGYTKDLQGYLGHPALRGRSSATQHPQAA
jgi:transcriptional regulator with XRE-family HTH domain